MIVEDDFYVEAEAARPSRPGASICHMRQAAEKPIEALPALAEAWLGSWPSTPPIGAVSPDTSIRFGRRRAAVALSVIHFFPNMQ